MHLLFSYNRWLFFWNDQIDKSGFVWQGEEIEKDTFVLKVGIEEDVPHYYFDEDGIKQLFPDDKWEMNHSCGTSRELY
ncbi:hypothetical protein [Enterococcus ureasiticus]|uniref:hypothetical protein n=2 Tax=Enterococcus TaxID=1350 RepID=UPI001F5FA036|nr:hypothetical protein [Enterococcus ureasiticus]